MGCKEWNSEKLTIFEMVSKIDVDLPPVSISFKEKDSSLTRIKIPLEPAKLSLSPISIKYSLAGISLTLFKKVPWVLPKSCTINLLCWL